MTDTTLGDKAETDYSATLFLPETDYPMRAGLPEREPIWLKRWEDLDLFTRQREQARGSGRILPCMMARPMPTATSISAMPSTRR